MFTRPQPISLFKLPLGPNHEFEVSGHHYTSVNCSSLPPNLASYMDMPQSPSLAQLCSCLWSADRHPYLAFLLQSPFIGQWAHFATPIDRIGLIHDRHGWHLPRDTQKEWKTFEQLMQANAERISNYLKVQFSELVDIWDEPAKPGLYGYFEVQSTKSQARNAITQSIDVFLVYMAYISFLMALHYYYPTSRDAQYPRPLFRQLIQETGLKLHPEWLHDLETSLVTQFHSDVRHVRSIVNVNTCKWLNLVPFMIEVNVPIWLYWGHPPLTSKDSQISWTSFYAPKQITSTNGSGTSWVSYYDPKNNGSSNDMEDSWPGVTWKADYTAKNKEPSHSMPLVATASPASSSTSKFPPVKPNSGQLSGESMRAFFQCRKERHIKIMQNETPQARQIRLSHEKSQATKPLSSKKGPVVYYWEKTGEFNIRI